jgi:hypothetical protein
MANSVPQSSAHPFHYPLGQYAPAKALQQKIFTCSQQDLDDIKNMISILAKEPLIALLPKKNELMAIGDRIRPVHPLKFLSIILSDSELKKCLQKIHDDKTVASWHGFSISLPSWGGFDGLSKWSYFSQNLEEALENKNQEDRSVISSLDFFIQEAKLDLSEDKKQEIYAYANAQDWKRFILFLLHSSNQN